MRLLQSLKPWLVAALMAVLLGWFVLSLPPTQQALVSPKRDVWMLPDLPRHAIDASSVVQAMAAPYWGAADAALTTGVSEVPAVDERWRIAAVFGTGKLRGALVSFADERRPPLRLFVGDKLPSGHRITQIEEREVCVRLGQRDFRLGVERREP